MEISKIIGINAQKGNSYVMLKIAILLVKEKLFLSIYLISTKFFSLLNSRTQTQNLRNKSQSKRIICLKMKMIMIWGVYLTE
jgi:hypothetical protein